MASIGIWIGAFLTLAFWSVLFKENPVFSFAEHVYVGLGAGQAIVVGWSNVQSLAINPLVDEGNLTVIIPLLLGILLYTRFLGSELRWLSRIPTALMVGIGAGLAFTRFAQSDLIGQVRGTMLSLGSIDHLIVVVGAMCTLAYFFFTSDHKVVTGMSKAGRMLMMVAFGSAFGNTVMGRLSLFIGRLRYLLGDWLGLI